MQLFYRLFYPLWRALPLDIGLRQRIQRRLFAAAPWIFRHHPAFGHFCTAGWSETREISAADELVTLLPRYVALQNSRPMHEPLARVLAFYLPQFHPIAENDAWWGEGFTEWSNVVRGTPRFPGHYQPHVPGELGYYDLRNPSILGRQIQLAKLYGIFGFVFYFYWFAGRRLLEKPLLNYLMDSRLQFPFCLCWANESWTRRWDGREKDVLLQQEYSEKDDLRFIEYVARYLRDPRYIRVRGRPLLIVYRPERLPTPKATARRWREWCQANGLGNPYLAYTQSFESPDPSHYGMDAALEFPPNNFGAADITGQVPYLDADFRGTVYDWSVFPQRSREYTDPGYTLFRGVATTWDNEARRPGRGAVFVGASAEGYCEWLDNAVVDTVRRTSEPTERLIFVNAWNEWAEGAHLEPDLRFGYAFLQATRDALERAEAGPRKRILLVVHDAQRNGAQLLALNLAHNLNFVFRYRVYVVLLGGGPLLPDFCRVARVSILQVKAATNEKARRLVRHLRAEGLSEAIVNSVASGLIVTALRESGIHVVSLVHELPGLIAKSKLERHAQQIGQFSNKVVFPAEIAYESYRISFPIPADKVSIRPQGLYKRCGVNANGIERARAEVRARFGLAAHTKLVLGAGYGDRRKGFDLFVDACNKVGKRVPEAVFLWIGRVDPDLERKVLRLGGNFGAKPRLVLGGYQVQTCDFFLAADVFAMTSREDPFPSVVLEALDAGLKVVAFDGAGGMSEIAAQAAMSLVPPFDTAAYSTAIMSALSAEPVEKRRVSNQARSFVSRECGFRRYVWDLLSLFPRSQARVSALLCGQGVLESSGDCVNAILRQTVPVYELLVTADTTETLSDGWCESLAFRLDQEAVLLPQTTLHQGLLQRCLQGAEQARGELVWLADARVIPECGLLQKALNALADFHHRTSDDVRPAALEEITSRRLDTFLATLGTVDSSLSGEPDRCNREMANSVDNEVETDSDCAAPPLIPRRYLVRELKKRIVASQ